MKDTFDHNVMNFIMITVSKYNHLSNTKSSGETISEIKPWNLPAVEFLIAILSQERLTHSHTTD